MKEITLPAILENIPAVTGFIDEQLEGLDCPIKAQMQIDVAVDEMFNNISSYAYTPDTGIATVRFEFDGDLRTVWITFIDSGIPFNPLEREAPDVTLPPEQRKIGGLGIFIVRKTMDEMQYCRRDGSNILRIGKRI